MLCPSEGERLHVADSEIKNQYKDIYIKNKKKGLPRKKNLNIQILTSRPSSHHCLTETSTPLTLLYTKRNL